MTPHQSILYHVDKGITRGVLLREMSERLSCCGACPNPHPMEDVERALVEMIADGTLVMGPLHGCPDFIVVEDWMPNSAAQIKAALNPEPEEPDDWSYDAADPENEADDFDDSLVTLGSATVGPVGQARLRKQ